MKYVLVIGDGMADAALEELDGKTPLESLELPYFDTLAGSCLGSAQTVPGGVAPGSDTAILNIFGYDPRQYYTGRSVLEAAGVGVMLEEGQVSFRVNLCNVEDGIIHSHNGGNVEGDDAEELMKALVNDPEFSAAAEKIGLKIHISRTFRHIGVINANADCAFTLTEPHNILEKEIKPYMPKGAFSDELTEIMLISHKVLSQHPVNQARRERGELAANMIWPWGPGRAARLDSFLKKYSHSGDVISAVPLVWGIAALAGLNTPKVEGANGDVDTNYEGKVNAALEALKRGDDFAAIHIEAPDEMSHAGKLDRKLEAITCIDRRVIRPLLERLPLIDSDFRILLLSDHPTLMTTRTHDGHAVPFAVYDSRHPGAPKKFDEKHAREGIFLNNGNLLMPFLFEIENVMQ